MRDVRILDVGYWMQDTGYRLGGTGSVPSVSSIQYPTSDTRRKEKALFHADAKTGEVLTSTRRGKARRKSSTVGCGKVAGNWRKLPATHTLSEGQPNAR